MSTELSPEEEARQLRTLIRLRTEHSTYLMNSGIARRILDAQVGLNYAQDDSEFTEGTLMYVSRKRMGEIAVGLLWGGQETYSGSCNQAPQDSIAWMRFLQAYPNADSLALSRIEAHSHGWSHAASVVGIQLERGSPEGILPLNGIEESDALEIVSMLRELEEKQQSGELSCLDPDSLLNTQIASHGPIPMP